MIEKLKKRQQELAAQLQAAQNRQQKAMSDIIAISGAMQEVDYWMKTLSESKGEENETADPDGSQSEK
jgi:hypothetical protein